MKKLNLLSNREMKQIMGGNQEEDSLDTKKNKCCPEGYSQGSSGSQIVCSDCVVGDYCNEGTLVAC